MILYNTTLLIPMWPKAISVPQDRYRHETDCDTLAII